MGGQGRPALYTSWKLPAEDESRRDSAILQRSARRYERGRTPPRTAPLCQALSAGNLSLRQSPSPESRYHRLGAGERLARRHIRSEAIRGGFFFSSGFVLLVW